MPTFQNDQWQEALVSLANGAGVGGGPATIADGADVAQGTTTDAANANTVVGQLKQVNTVQGAVADTAVSNPASSGSVIALLKGIITKLAGTLTISGSVTTSGTVTEANSAAVKTDLDTIAGSISSNKMATKAASGDFADGAINTIGAQADAAYTDGTGAASGTSQGLFKGIFVKLAAIATSVAGVLATKRSTVAVYSLASTTTSGSTQNSGDLTVGAYTELSIDINTTAQAGTSPTLQLFYERKGADNLYYVLWQSAVLTAAANTLSTSIGAGMVYNQSLGLTGRLRWVVGGSATPTWTFSANLQGK